MLKPKDANFLRVKFLESLIKVKLGMKSKKILAFFMSSKKRRIDNGLATVAYLLFPFLHLNSISNRNVLLTVKSSDGNMINIKKFNNN